MGAILRYLFYVFVIIVLYLLVVGIYEGTINKNTTLGAVTDDVTQGTQEIISDGYKATKDAFESVVDNKE